MFLIELKLLCNNVYAEEEMKKQLWYIVFFTQSLFNLGWIWKLILLLLKSISCYLLLIKICSRLLSNGIHVVQIFTVDRGSEASRCVPLILFKYKALVTSYCASTWLFGCMGMGRTHKNKYLSVIFLPGYFKIQNTE